eukprot:2490372-Pyramimonas_sp.AAC.1
MGGGDGLHQAKLPPDAIDTAIFLRLRLFETWFELVAAEPRLRSGIATAWPRVVAKLQRPRRWNNVVSHLSAVIGTLLDLGWSPDNAAWSWTGPT